MTHDAYRSPRTNRARTLEAVAAPVVPMTLEDRLTQCLARLDAGEGRLVRALVADADGLLVAGTSRETNDEETAAVAAVASTFIERLGSLHGRVAHVSVALERGRVLGIHPLGDDGGHIVVLAQGALDPQRIARAARELTGLLAARLDAA